MPRNGSGTYSLPEPPFVAGTIISSAAMNDDLSDIGSALTGSLPRDGQAGMSGQLKVADGSALLPGIAFTNDLNTGFYRPTDDQLAVICGGVQVGLFDASGLQGALPVGCVLDFAGSSTPTYFILCYGQNVLRANYPALFTAIGTTYGVGNGSTTFGLPDLRGSIVYGKDNMGGVAASNLTTTYYGTDPTGLGNRGGTQSKQLATANLPAYTPTGSVSLVLSGTIPTAISAAANQVGSGAPFTDIVQGGSNAVNFTGSSASFTGTAQGGSQTAFSLIVPGLIMNKIIYAGA